MTHEPITSLDQALAHLSDRFLNNYRQRYPEEAARLEALYTVEQLGNGPGQPATFWLKEGDKLIEPFGSQATADEGRLAAILGKLSQYDLQQRAAHGQL